MPRESQLYTRGAEGGQSAVVVVAGAAAASASIAAPGNNFWKRLEFVPARRKEASPPPAHGVPIIRLDVPEPKLPDKKNAKEAMAREKSALAVSNGKHVAAAAAPSAVAVDDAAAGKNKKKKAKASSSSSRPAAARELYPSASLKMRWVEPLKPVRKLVVVFSGEEESESTVEDPT